MILANPVPEKKTNHAAEETHHCGDRRHHARPRDIGALALPLLGSARESAHRSTCVENLKQLGMVLSLYATENKDRFPRIDDTKNNLIFDANLLFPEYAQDAPIAVCPASPGFDPKTTFRLKSNARHPFFEVGDVHPDCITGDSYTYLGLVTFNDKDAETFFGIYDNLSKLSHAAEAYRLIGPGGSASLPVVWDRPTAKKKARNHPGLPFGEPGRESHAAPVNLQLLDLIRSSDLTLRSHGSWRAGRSSLFFPSHARCFSRRC
jgi:hypothetical protein